MSNNSFPWPSKGTVLFRGDADDWRNNACINFDPHGWWGYAEGFRLGADYLVKRVEETGSDQDYLVYPVVFGYRHAVELRLKSLTWRLRELLDEQENASREHRLFRLWSTTRGLSEEAFPDQSKEDLDAAEEVIAQLHQADPASTGFRYPETLNGEPSLKHLDVRINLRHLRDRMTELFNFLDATGSLVAMALDDNATR